MLKLLFQDLTRRIPESVEEVTLRVRSAQGHRSVSPGHETFPSLWALVFPWLGWILYPFSCIPCNSLPLQCHSDFSNLYFSMPWFIWLNSQIYVLTLTSYFQKQTPASTTTTSLSRNMPVISDLGRPSKNGVGITSKTVH